jgi:glutamine amidotransferase
MNSAAIVNVGCGNIGSLYKALDLCFDQVSIITTPAGLDKFDYVFLPGSGSAGVFRDQLTQRGFENAIHEVIEVGRRVVGICLGFQLLFNGTEEDGGVPGLGYFDGKVTKIEHLAKKASRTGWYESTGGRSWSLESDRNFFYFNHAFGVGADSFCPLGPHGRSDSIISWAKAGNVAGFQFHPEKSQSTGYKLLQSIGRCDWHA